MLSMFQHLLPRSKAWSLTATKNLRKFFEGLSASLITTTREYIDHQYAQLSPKTTNRLDKWARQFGLPLGESIVKVEAAWKEGGNPTLPYIQERLQAAGYMVYLHEFPDPDFLPNIVPRDPRLYLWPTTQPPVPDNPALGYPLVNNSRFADIKYVTSMSTDVLSCLGNEKMSLGRYNDYAFTPVRLEVPNDPALWPYFVYVGDEIFPQHAILDPSQQEGFERLLKKLIPSHLWIGVLVNYGGVPN